MLLVLSVAESAQAYCTLNTCQDVTPQQAAESGGKLEPKTCEKEGICIVEGHEMYWDSPCLSFGVSALNTSVLGLTAEEFHDIVVQAYDVWATVECPGGGHPDFEVGSVGIVDSNGNFFCDAEPFSNISVWSLVNRWERDPRALGYTGSSHNVKTGEILDADVELNLHKIETEHEGNYAAVLSYTAVHEAGHYLGLAHSSDEGAVMYEFYDPTAQSSPNLEPDDIDGICKLYPPKKARDCSEPGYVPAGLDAQGCEDAAQEADDAEREAARDAVQSNSGCSVAAAEQRGQSAWLWAGLSLLGLGIGRRHASSRRQFP